jgi:hypothetical protein
MKQLPKALDRNGDLWVAAPTKHLLFRVLQDVRAALESPADDARAGHAEHLASLAKVEALLGLDQFDRALPPVHEQLGEPTAQQACVLRNLYRLKPI